MANFETSNYAVRMPELDKSGTGQIFRWEMVRKPYEFRIEEDKWPITLSAPKPSEACLVITNPTHRDVVRLYYLTREELLRLSAACADYVANTTPVEGTPLEATHE